MTKSYSLHKKMETQNKNSPTLSIMTLPHSAPTTITKTQLGLTPHSHLLQTISIIPHPTQIHLAALASQTYCLLSIKSTKYSKISPANHGPRILSPSSSFPVQQPPVTSFRRPTLGRGNCRGYTCYRACPIVGSMGMIGQLGTIRQSFWTLS